MTVVTVSNKLPTDILHVSKELNLIRLLSISRSIFGPTAIHKLKGRSFVVVVVCPSVCHGCIVAKRCKIRPRLLMNTNRKSHTGFQMTYKLMTSDDLKVS